MNRTTTQQYVWGNTAYEHYYFSSPTSVNPESQLPCVFPTEKGKRQLAAICFLQSNCKQVIQYGPQIQDLHMNAPGMDLAQSLLQLKSFRHCNIPTCPLNNETDDSFYPEGCFVLRMRLGNGQPSNRVLWLIRVYMYIKDIY